MTEDLESESKLKWLLYEQGKKLEDAIHEALLIMGFTVESFDDGIMEIDFILSSPEGLFLGEAEGKNNKAINIEKYSQLERNLLTYLDKYNLEKYPKGVLFGNAYREVEPSNRGAYFTKQCLMSAERTKTALVRTPDLFEVAKYIKEHSSDVTFVKASREKILNTEGTIVDFKVPK